MNIQQMIAKKKVLCEKKIAKIETTVNALEALVHDEDIRIFISAENANQLGTIIHKMSLLLEKHQRLEHAPAA